MEVGIDYICIKVRKQAKLKFQLSEMLKFLKNEAGRRLLYSCNMGMNGLPDIYTESTRAAGLRAEGVYIRQTTRAHVTTVMYHLFIGQKPT